MKANKGQLFGTVKVDETYVGGLVRNMHKSKVDKSKVGTGEAGARRLWRASNAGTKKKCGQR